MSQFFHNYKDRVECMMREEPLQFWLKLAISVAGGFSVALGLIVLTGWHSHNVALIHIQPHFVPMQYNTAIGLLLSGLALLALDNRQPRLALVCAAIVMALGVATLLQYIIGVDLGIDQLLMQHYISVKTSHPGRMAPNTALCFMFIGSAVLLSAGILRQWAALIKAILGSLLLGFAVIALFGYVIGLESIYGWGQLTRMALHTADGFIVVGCGFILLAWRMELANHRWGMPVWLPVPVGIGSLVVCISFWQVLYAGQNTSIMAIAHHLLLIFGGLLSVVLALLVYLAQQTWRRAKLAEASQHALALEITEREKTEKALRISEERFQLIITGSDEGVWDWDIIADKDWWSPRFYSLLGYRNEEITASSQQFAQMIHPDERDAVQQVAVKHIEERTAYVLEYRMLTKSGEYRWFHGRGQAIWDHDGRPVRMLGTLRDINERKQAEQRHQKLEQQLFQSQKIEAVGQLTGGIAHDFNNLLAVIIGNLELLTSKLVVDAKQHSYIQNALHSAQRGASLTQRLLTFSRKQMLKSEIVDLGEQVRHMEEMLQRTLGEIIEIDILCAEDLWQCRTDKSQLESVLLNLAINARDAMPGGGRITLETSNARLDDSYTEQVPELISGDYVMLAVSDRGEGMSAEILQHVFEPYYTTKDVGKGSGLGLSMAYGFAKQSNGHLIIYSEVGQGTTVKLYLPRYMGKHEVQQVLPVEQVINATETILVVEDEPDLLEVYVLNLEMLGYTVLSADQGKTAIQLFNDNKGIKLLLTDVMLPGGINGPDIVKALQKKDPDVRFLYMSGYTENAIIHDGYLDDDIEFLRKPFTITELSKKLREILAH